LLIARTRFLLTPRTIPAGSFEMTTVLRVVILNQ
jgi:hypothetical protein